MKSPDKTKTPEHTRAAWAERFAIRTGRISRGDIVEAFGVSNATASTDLAYLQTEHPGLIEYDTASRSYTLKNLSSKKPPKPKLARPPFIAEFDLSPE